jgi:hypothetical protein
VILHIWAFHTTGNNNPTGVEVRRTSKKEAEADTLPFWPYFVIKDLFALAVILVVFFAIVGFMPNYLGHPDNYIEANPLVTPAHIVPEWYFLPFYAILRAFDDDVWVVIAASFLTGGIIDAKFFGVLAMFGAIVVMALAPWLDTSSVRSGRYRPMFKWWFWLFVVNFFVLMWAGAMPAEGIYPYIALIGSAYWFAYFLVILPLLGVIEKPLPQPRRSRTTSSSTTASPTAAGRRDRTLRIAGRVTEKDDMSMFRKLAITAVTAARSPSPRGWRSPPGARATSRITASPSKVPSAGSTRTSCSAACRSIPRSARPATACATCRCARCGRGRPGLTEEEVRAYIEMNFIEVYDDDIQDWRAATPNDHFPESSLENAPDLSLMTKARAGFHGPYGLGSTRCSAASAGRNTSPRF